MTQFLDQYEIILHFPKLAAIFKKNMNTAIYYTICTV